LAYTSRSALLIKGHYQLWFKEYWFNSLFRYKHLILRQTGYYDNIFLIPNSLFHYDWVSL